MTQSQKQVSIVKKQGGLITVILNKKDGDDYPMDDLYTITDSDNLTDRCARWYSFNTTAENIALSLLALVDDLDEIYASPLVIDRCIATTGTDTWRIDIFVVEGDNNTGIKNNAVLAAAEKNLQKYKEQSDEDFLVRAEMARKLESW